MLCLGRGTWVVVRGAVSDCEGLPRAWRECGFTGSQTQAPLHIPQHLENPIHHKNKAKRGHVYSVMSCFPFHFQQSLSFLHTESGNRH